jgi:hypothetical protein
MIDNKYGRQFKATEAIEKNLPQQQLLKNI